jgi:hypothetical protein
MNIMLTLTQTTHRLKSVWRSALLLAMVLSTFSGVSFAAVQTAPGDLDTSFAGFQL